MIAQPSATGVEDEAQRSELLVSKNAGLLAIPDFDHGELHVWETAWLVY